MEPAGQVQGFRVENSARSATVNRKSKIANLQVPIYEYELCEGKCKMCGGRFTLGRPLKAAPLTQCPACKKPVRKIISPFHSPVELKPVSISDAINAGFSVLNVTSHAE